MSLPIKEIMMSDWVEYSPSGKCGQVFLIGQGGVIGIKFPDGGVVYGNESTINSVQLSSSFLKQNGFEKYCDGSLTLEKLGKIGHRIETKKTNEGWDVKIYVDKCSDKGEAWVRDMLVFFHCIVTEVHILQHLIRDAGLNENLVIR